MDEKETQSGVCHGAALPMPCSWMVGYDKGVVMKRKDLYDLRAIPTLYLLDRDKRVLLKDARFEEVLEYIENKVLLIGER